MLYLLIKYCSNLHQEFEIGFLKKVGAFKENEN